jgi:hypothetical protein
MKKFAFAAIALFGVCLLVPFSPSVAKSGGGGGGFKGGFAFKGGFKGKHAWQPSFKHWQFAHNRHHHRRNNLNYGWGYGGAAIVAAPYLYGQPTNDVTGSIPEPQRVAQPVIRSVAESQQACSAEHVLVRSESGGETTVTVIRC